jgi:hypothetical protein
MPAARLREHQQMPHARPMHFDAEVVALGMRLREIRQVLAIAEADLERARRVASEQRGEVQRHWRIR